MTTVDLFALEHAIRKVCAEATLTAGSREQLEVMLPAAFRRRPEEEPPLIGALRAVIQYAPLTNSVRSELLVELIRAQRAEAANLHDGKSNG